MSEFWIYFEIGLRHILDIKAYDHILFLIALTVPYAFKDWKKVLILVTIFTLAHTVALALSAFNWVVIKVSLTAFLIPVIILITALFHLFTAGKSSKNESISIIGFISLFFGIVHGLGYAEHFRTLAPASGKLIPMLEISLGIETAQIIVVIVVLILSYIVQTFFRFSKRDWTLVMSAFVIGVVLPMIIASEIWK
ncbi:HupE/UreJ family protein [Flavobacterium sp. 3HN19-14]|uniref:HupE/UreJ family protein n=1 Tax=Flavobacterium sp. 3HN19-14 TaxID=3448133 RepID=UPI003EE126B6